MGKLKAKEPAVSPPAATADSSDDPVAIAGRAAARGSWPVRSFRLGDEPPDDLRATTTARERLAMVWTLTQEAWGLGGLPIPDYPRTKIPVAVRCLRDAT